METFRGRSKKTLIFDYGAASEAFGALKKMKSIGKQLNGELESLDKTDVAHKLNSIVDKAIKKENKLSPENVSVSGYIKQQEKDKLLICTGGCGESRINDSLFQTKSADTSKKEYTLKGPDEFHKKQKK